MQFIRANTVLVVCLVSAVSVSVTAASKIALCDVEPSAGGSTRLRTNEVELLQIAQAGTNVGVKTFFDAVTALGEIRSTNAVNVLVGKIDYRRKPERDVKTTGLGPPEMFDEAWPVASALVNIGEPSLEGLTGIIEKGEDRKKITIAETAMLKILGYQKRNAYLLKRIEKTTDRNIIERLQRYIVPESSSQ